MNHSYTIIIVIEALYSAYKNGVIQMTNDRPIHRLIYQWQASINFNWLMAGQYDVIFYEKINRNGINTFFFNDNNYVQFK